MVRGLWSDAFGREGREGGTGTTATARAVEGRKGPSLWDKPDGQELVRLTLGRLCRKALAQCQLQWRRLSLVAMPKGKMPARRS